ncbi:MAG: hypothetical protein FJ086_19040 [Deltaproteobacteria bacterium]|nr:hypothetical protein [Deltaproteobacteria bacterium]
MKPLFACAAAAVLSAFTGCATAIGIVRTRPAPVNLSPARDVSLEVRAREMGMREALATALGGGGLVAATRALELSLHEELSGPRSRFRVLPPESAQCRLGVTVLDWNHELRVEQPQQSGSGTNKTPPAPKRTLHGHMEAVLAATCAHRGQEVLTRNFAVHRTADLAVGAYELGVHEQLLRDEARELANNMAASITPNEYSDHVRIDDGEQALAPVVKLMKDGQLPAARAALEAHLQAKPGSAAAAYNLGVLDEADGNLAAARGRYAQAQGLAPSSLYADGLERVARVERERAALAGQQP